MASGDLVLAVTGASGSPYAVRLLETLARAGRSVHLTISPAAAEVFAKEIGTTINLDDKQFDLGTFLGRKDVDASRIRYHHYRNFQAGIASGSFLTAGMVVVPCSMKTLSAIAGGQADDLLGRAADVILKERRRLVLVVREAPLNDIHLEHMLKLSRMGVVIFPPVPAFYDHPRSVDDLVNHTVSRVLDLFDIHLEAARWDGIMTTGKRSTPPVRGRAHADNEAPPKRRRR